MISDYLEQLRIAEADETGVDRYEETRDLIEKIKKIAEEEPQEFAQAIVQIPISEETLLLWEDLLETVFPVPSLVKIPLLQDFFLRELDCLLELAEDDKTRKSALVRGTCAEIIGFLIDEDSDRDLAVLERMLESDPDWRNRDLAHGILEDCAREPGKLSILDRLRVRLSRFGF